MEQEKLNQPLHEVFKLICEYIEEYGEPPYRNNAWFEEKTKYQYEGNYISNKKAELKKLKYVNEDLNLTPKGKRYAKLHFGTFTVRGVEVHVQGSVFASPTQDLLVNWDEYDKPSDDTILVPKTSLEKDTFALKVSGPSMKEMGILNGDYVIVEKQESLWWPDPQDIIIARYLPHYPNQACNNDQDFDKYIGPVIKIYRCRFGERGCELGWRRANEINPYVILADHLLPLGKVVAVYRDLSQFSLLDV